MLTMVMIVEKEKFEHIMFDKVEIRNIFTKIVDSLTKDIRFCKIQE